jgi:triosephosphate isomerase
MPLVAGNWKMNLDHLEAIALVQQLSYQLDPRDLETVEVLVIPPFTALRSVQTLIEGDRLRIALGAQDVHWEDSGAHTGEISAPMLARLKVRYVLCGHSERRAAGETDETVNAKLRAVLRHGMVPILCVGETLEERDAGQANEVVVDQLRASLKGVDTQAAGELVVAYEPVWAIGTGRNALPEEADDMCGVVRSTLAELYGQEAADRMRVLYGGSVKPGNAVDLLNRPAIDGALVGGASLDAEDFAVICRFSRR